MDGSITEQERIRKALWALVDDLECPRTTKLDAIDRLIELDKQRNTRSDFHGKLEASRKKASA